MRKLCQTNTTKDDYVAGLAWCFAGLAFGEVICCAQAELSAARDRIAKQEVQRSFCQASDSRNAY